jgi:hypothetical protein
MRFKDASDSVTETVAPPPGDASQPRLFCHVHEKDCRSGTRLRGRVRHDRRSPFALRTSGSSASEPEFVELILFEAL